MAYTVYLNGMRKPTESILETKEIQYRHMKTAGNTTTLLAYIVSTLRARGETTSNGFRHISGESKGGCWQYCVERRVLERK